MREARILSPNAAGLREVVQVIFTIFCPFVAHLSVQPSELTMSDHVTDIWNKHLYYAVWGLHCMRPAGFCPTVQQ